MAIYALGNFFGGPTVTIPAGSLSQARAACPSGSFPTTGGYEANGPGITNVVVNSTTFAPASDIPPAGGWVFIAINLSNHDITFTPEVVCATLHP